MVKGRLRQYFWGSLLIATATLILFVASTPQAFSTDPFTPAPNPGTIQTVESDDEVVGRTGNWTPQSTSQASGGSYLYSSGSTADVLTLQFEGTTIEIVYVTDPALGSFAIEIDNTIVRTVETTSAETTFGNVATVDYLDNGSHTLKVFPVSGTIGIDAFLRNVGDVGVHITGDNSAIEYTIPANDIDELIQAFEACSEDTDVIVHLASGAGYEITQPYANTAFGLPPIERCTLTINGNGSTIFRNFYSPSFSMLRVAVGGSLILDNVTIEGGQLDEPATTTTAGIYVLSGNLWIRNNSVVKNNTIGSVTNLDRSAAGIWFQSFDSLHTLFIEDSVISHNENLVEIESTNLIHAGGIGMHGGTLIIRNSEIRDNVTTGNGGGIGTSIARVNPQLQSTFNIENTNFRNNLANIQGDAIFWQSHGTHHIHNSCIYGNRLSPTSPMHYSVSQTWAGLIDARENWWGPVSASNGRPSNFGGDAGNDTLGMVNGFEIPSLQPSPSPNENGDPDCREPIIEPTPTPTMTPSPTPEPCYATVIFENPISFRVVPNLDDNSYLFKINSDMLVVEPKEDENYPNIPSVNTEVSINVTRWYGVENETYPSGLDTIVTWLEVTVIPRNGGQSISGYMGLRTSTEGQLLSLGCNENSLPNYPPPSPTPLPTSTSVPASSIWYVTCHNLTGPLRVRNESDSLTADIIAELPRGSDVVRVSLDEIDDPSSNIVFVKIFWPRDSNEIAYVAIRDGSNPDDGDYLTDERDPSCESATITPTPLPPTLQPTFTPTPDPSIPRVSLSPRFNTGNETYGHIFGGQTIAVVGSYGFHDGDNLEDSGTTLDIMPSSLERCIETRVGQEHCDPELEYGGPIPVYAPFSGCITSRSGEDVVNIAMRPPSYADTHGCGHHNTWKFNGSGPIEARREIWLEHVRLDSNLVHWQSVDAGQLVGFVRNDENELPHIGVSLRFYSPTGIYKASQDELKAVLTATGGCLVDEWFYYNDAAPARVVSWSQIPYQSLRVQACYESH